ncbi:MAG TPA: hypothetical protein VMQ44_01945 [Candidatus Saccharimonadales bacterium]|nr:hypothetical protein [Candidatus Saccharimonadales bacterium]
MAKIFTKIVTGLVLVIVGGVVFSVNPNHSATTVKAGGAPDVKTDWTATQLLAINTKGTTGDADTAVNTRKTEFAIGVAAWHVNYQQKNSAGTYTTVYKEDWSLPSAASIPNCYANSAQCSPGGAYASQWLWAYAREDESTCQESNWQFTATASNDPALYVTNPSSRAGGPGAISGVDDRNINQLLTLGAYGWLHGEFAKVGTRGTVICAGTMIPLEWVVSGTFQ